MIPISTPARLCIQDSDISMINFEQQIRRLEGQIALFSTIIPKTIHKINEEIKTCNARLGSPSRSDDDENERIAIRQTKRELRQCRTKLWAKLMVLPSLEEEHRRLLDLRRRQQKLETLVS